MENVITLAFITGPYDTSKNRGTLSSPVFMDNVACYGTESKLIDCTYHTDTSEDKHSEDIWINCGTPAPIATSSSIPVPEHSMTTIPIASSPTLYPPTSTNEKLDQISHTAISTVSLVVALTALCISVLVIVFLIGYITAYKHKEKKSYFTGDR